MADRYPGYDVLAKQDTESWNAQTREAIDRRLAISDTPRFFSPGEWKTLSAVCDRILPQPDDRPKAPLAAYVDQKMADDDIDGYRYAELPPQGEAWRRGLAALDQEARAAHGAHFADLEPALQDDLLRRMQHGQLGGEAWKDMPCKSFFEHRVLHDVTHAYYALPVSWNEIGFGGPASPRGYVRMALDRRDPWEAVEVHGDDADAVRRRNARVR